MESSGKLISLIQLVRMWPVCGVLLALLLCVQGKANTSEVVKLSFLTSVWKPGQGRWIGGAFFNAMTDIKSRPEDLRGYELESLFADTKDDVRVSIQAMTDHYMNGTIGFIGPEGKCAIEANIATSWNLPMISYVSTRHLNPVFESVIYLQFMPIVLIQHLVTTYGSTDVSAHFICSVLVFCIIITLV